MPTVKLEDAADHFEELAARMQKAALRGLYVAGLKGAQVIVSQIIPSRSPQPVDRGTYRAGWGPHSVTRQGDKVILQNLEKVAPIIEDGARPENIRIGGAMIRALSEWALRKGLAEDAKEAKSVAFAIAKTMKKRGIFNRNGKKGLHILGELMDKRIKTIIRQEVWYAVQKEIDRG